MSKEWIPTEQDFVEFEQDVENGVSPGQAMTTMIDKSIIRDLLEAAGFDSLEEFRRSRSEPEDTPR